MEYHAKHYWQHKENYEGDVARPLLDAGYLCYGWVFISKELSNLDDWGKIQQCIKEEFGNDPRNRFCLKRFLCDMKAGDWVLVPGYGDFSIYKITDDKAYSIKEIPDGVMPSYLGLVRGEDGFWKRANGEDLDIGLFRKVEKVLGNIIKDDYAPSRLISRMKYRMANIGLDDLKDDVEIAYSNARYKEKIKVRNKVFEKAPELLASIKPALSPGKFEKLVGWYFKKLGATSVDIPSKNMHGKTGEEDVDITAFFEPLKICFHVQIKFHDDVSGYKAVSQVSKAKGTGHYEKYDADDNIYWALTSGDSFSVEAQKIAADEHVRLISGEEFMKMLLDVGINDIDSAF